MRFSRHHAIFLGLLIAGCSSSETTSTTSSGTSGSGGSGGEGGGGPKGSLLVKTDKGTVEGALDGSTRAFLGIPFQLVLARYAKTESLGNRLAWASALGLALSL